MFKVIFEYDEASRKWEVFVEGATTALEAVQGFNAVVITAHEATPTVAANKAMHEITPLMNRYKIIIGV